MGGPVDAGSPYVVGENGPEVIVPNHSGQVVPTAAVAQAKKMLKGAPPAGVNLSKVKYK
jgi:phage-related minor tail protein